jgi:uncharacterized protein (TIGR00251 family)
VLYELQVEFHKDFVKVNENKITIGIKSKPINGKANKEIIKKLAKYFGISSAHICIKSGQKTKQKIVEIQDKRT